MDVQSAESLAKYPDFVAAKALARIPGVSVAGDAHDADDARDARDADDGGEGRVVSIRGMDNQPPESSTSN